MSTRNLENTWTKMATRKTVNVGELRAALKDMSRNAIGIGQPEARIAALAEQVIAAFAGNDEMTVYEDGKARV